MTTTMRTTTHGCYITLRIRHGDLDSIYKNAFSKFIVEITMTKENDDIVFCVSQSERNNEIK